MLAEIFLARLQAMVQEFTRNGSSPSPSDARFVPVKLPNPSTDKDPSSPGGTHR